MHCLKIDTRKRDFEPMINIFVKRTCHVPDNSDPRARRIGASYSLLGYLSQYSIALNETYDSMITTECGLLRQQMELFFHVHLGFSCSSIRTLERKRLNVGCESDWSFPGGKRMRYEEGALRAEHRNPSLSFHCLSIATDPSVMVCKGDQIR